MAREKLKAARVAKGMTQQQVADHLGVSLRHYCRIESGGTVGTVALWDELEDLFGVNQRELRRLDPGGDPPKR